MLFILIFLNFSLSFEKVEIHKHSDNLPLTNLTHNDEGVVMGFGINFIENQKSLVYYLYSNNNGIDLDTISSFLYISNPNQGLNQIYSSASFKDNFYFFSDWTTIFKTNDNGNTIDTFVLNENDKFISCKFSISQNDTIIALYSYYNINQNGKPEFDLYYSIDGFESYEIIDFPNVKDTFNIIQDIKIENSIIKVFTTTYLDSAQYQIKKFSYNLNAKNYTIDTFSIVDFFNFDVIVNFNDDILIYTPLIYEYFPKGKSTYNRMLMKLNKNGYQIIDTIGRGSSKPGTLSYFDGNKIFSLYSSRLSIYDLKTNQLDTFHFSEEFFNSKGCTQTAEESHSWLNKTNNTLMISSGWNCIYELDINALLSVENENSNTLIFPNPAPKGQSINIELDEYGSNVTIYDLLGNEIYSVNQFSNKYEIPTANLSSGIYITVIDLGGKRKISKFVVE